MQSVGDDVAHPLRQSPAVLALHRAEQLPQIVQSSRTRLRAPESYRDAFMHPFNALFPPGHFRQITFPNSRCLTSPTVNCLDSSCC